MSAQRTMVPDSGSGSGLAVIAKRLGSNMRQPERDNRPAQPEG